MVNIYDTANQLASDLEQMDTLKDLKDVFAKLRADKDAYALFDKVQNLQVKLSEKNFKGEDITEEELKEMQGYTEQFDKFPVIGELMVTERKVNQLVQELNQIITKPIADIYNQK